MLEAAGRLPDALVACVGGGSNAIGLFHEFLNDQEIEIYGVEGGGDDFGIIIPIIMRSILNTICTITTIQRREQAAQCHH